MESQGYMHFKRPLTQREQQIMDQNLGSIIEIDEWWMGDSLITQLKDNIPQISFGECFNQIDRSEFILRYTDQNERKEVIHDLINIKFPNLTAINFSTNNIESISDLQLLDAPSLTYLTLSFNNITNFKTLTKCFFPNLKGLYVHSNKAASLDWLPLLTTSGSLDFIFLEYDQNQEPVMQENLGLLFKLEAKNVKKIEWSCPNSIQNEKQISMLGRRYPKIIFDKKEIK